MIFYFGLYVKVLGFLKYLKSEVNKKPMEHKINTPKIRLDVIEKVLCKHWHRTKVNINSPIKPEIAFNRMTVCISGLPRFNSKYS